MKTIRKISLILLAFFAFGLTLKSNAMTYPGMAFMNNNGDGTYSLYCPFSGACWTGVNAVGNTIHVWGYGDYVICSVVAQGHDPINDEIEMTWTVSIPGQ